MRTHFIKKLLNLEGAIIKKSHFFKNNIIFYVEMPVSVHVCPNCGTHTTKIHDYYTQPIKDIPIFLKPTKLIYRKRRYECPNCHNSFYENRKNACNLEIYGQ